MIALPQHSSVLIVGAGPSGLMMAAQLLRYGIQPVIIDSKQGPTTESRALVVQARSLEIYRQMGLVNEVLKNGTHVNGAAMYMQGEEKARLSLSGIGEGQTPYPFLELYEQSKNERLLLDYLTVNCCPVYWETTLISLKKDKETVSVILQNGDVNYNITCNYVVGADGAHSVVRKQLAILFSGDTYQHKFFLADIKLNSFMNKDVVNLFLAKNGFAGFFPIPGNHTFRVVANLPNTLSDNPNVTVADALPHLEAVTRLKLDIDKVNWFTTYRLHHRMAEKFNDGTCFLIGDAAHIHSPVGGQGMNTGLQDAYNLAWKLAGVINKQIKPVILNSYAAERMPLAKALLTTTDRAFSIVMSANWFVNLLKTWLLPKLLKRAWSKEKSRTAFFKMISQTGIHYRDSKINLQLGKITRIKAGDRLPYLEIFDEKKKAKTDIHVWCSKPGFTLITFGEISESFLFTLAKWITQNYQGSLNFFHLPTSANNSAVFDAFEVSTGSRKAIIIRPDMYIGYINDMVDIEMMDNYLRNVVGFN